jgi:hypothetical protein
MACEGERGSSAGPPASTDTLRSTVPIGAPAAATGAST